MIDTAIDGKVRYTFLTRIAIKYVILYCLLYILRTLTLNTEHTIQFCFPH